MKKLIYICRGNIHIICVNNFGLWNRAPHYLKMYFLYQSFQLLYL